MPMIDERFDGEHHAGFNRRAIAAAQNRLLLVPPRPDAVPDEGRLVAPADLAERRDRRLVDLAGRNAGPAARNGARIDLAIGAVVPLLLRAGSTQHRVAAL